VPGTVDTGNHCDDCTTQIALPFPYELYNPTFTSAWVSSNGQLDFSSPPDGGFSPTCLPDASAHDAIFAYWHDLRTDLFHGRHITGPPPGIYTSLSGTAPNRIFNIEWRAHYINGSGSINFEVRLYENIEKFDFIYGAVPEAGSSATVGVQRDTGSSVTQQACNVSDLSNGLRITFLAVGQGDGDGDAAVGVAVGVRAADGVDRSRRRPCAGGP